MQFIFFTIFSEIFVVLASTALIHQPQTKRHSINQMTNSIVYVPDRLLAVVRGPYKR